MSLRTEMVDNLKELPKAEEGLNGDYDRYECVSKRVMLEGSQPCPVNFSGPCSSFHEGPNFQPLDPRNDVIPVPMSFFV